MIPSQAQRLTMICALALADGIESQSDLAVRLKWPNDIMINGKKAGGILTELEVRTGVIDYAIVGVGLNVNLNLADLPEDIALSATSLAHETGRFVSRLSLLRQFLEALEERYLRLQAGQSPHREWTNRLVMLGSRVAIRSGEQSLEGIAEGVNELGALLIRLDDGNFRTVLAGDVTVHS
jgi:BirA family biotin operon repressor/biotin-[acetyl-CoA-carboxylase] ligase